MPGKKNQAVVKCTGCGGTNEGKPTYAYNDPLMAHAGRYVDSNDILNYQNVGIRTVRAKTIRVSPDGQRLYAQLGEAVGGYALNKFFATTLKSPMPLVSALPTGQRFSGRGDQMEKVADVDSLFYAESPKSGWSTSLIDSQKHLYDFDSDDRGYVYVGTVYYGWGIAKDNQNGDHMASVTGADGKPINLRDANPSSIFVLKMAGKYYVVPSVVDSKDSTVQIYDVTTPSNPVKQVTRKGTNNGILRWAKSDQAQRVAMLTLDGHVRIYDYNSFIQGAAPLVDKAPTPGKRLIGVSIDETGRVWVAETSPLGQTNVLYRFAPSGGGYTETPFNVYGESFSPAQIHAAAGYIAVSGKTAVGDDVLLLKVEGGTPRLLDTDHFFNKYYFDAPDGYAIPTTRYMTSDGGLQIVESANRTYLMVALGGMADVFEIQGGESLSVSMTAGSFGTQNPNAPNSDGTPFYGDVLKFRATSSSSSATYGVNWDFGNPESGLSGNLASSALGATVSHQYTGLDTLAEITQTRTVSAQASTDGAIAGMYSVTMAAPTARIKVPGRAAAMTQSTRAAFEAVPGESFLDASDGVVEGHVAAWIIDGVETKKAPNAPMPVGTTLGSHTVSLESRYGKSDNALNINNPYVSKIQSVTYTLKPFVAVMAPARSTTTSYIFEATGRFTADKQLLNATQWTVTWSATGASSTAVEAMQTNTVALGTIPPFEVAKSAASNGTVVKLQITVDAAAVTAPAYATYVAQQTLAIPDPEIQITSGCTNASEPCTLTAVSKSGASTEGWQISWSVKQGVTQVKDGSGLSINFTPTAAGAYSATVTETRFNITGTKGLTVAAATCGPVPEEFMAAISTDCGFDCKVNTEINFDPNIKPGYKVQPCDELSWNFGDNTPVVKERAPKHTYARNGTFKVTFTIKNSTGSRTWTKDVIIGGTTTPPDPVVCTIPVAPTITYSGSKGCAPGKACTTSEQVTFVATRAGGNLQACDATAWTFPGNEVVNTRSPRRTFNTAGTHVVSLVLSNTAGTAAPVSVSIPVVSDGPVACQGAAQPGNLGVEYLGAESGCNQIEKTKPCKVGEVIQFTLTTLGYSLQACDTIAWNFGDNGTSSARNPQHTYTSLSNTRAVSVKVSNANNAAGATVNMTVPFGNVPVLVVPQLEFVGFPSSAAKGTSVTFTARVKNDVDATGWTWNFGDSSQDNSQVAVVGKTVSVTHTYATKGNFNVSVRARHAQAGAGAETGTAVGTITIDDTPEYKYLLPVVVSSPGQNNSTWRTDVQIYTPDSTISNTNKLSMSATMRDVVRTLDITKSTTIYEDFMKTFSGDKADSGAVIITVKTRLAPQIWTRTYNQAANGTFGQFIPAIRIDAAGGGAAFGEGKYFLAGLRHDVRYRTNLGFLNPNAQTIAATVRVYDDAGLQLGAFNRTLQPFQLDQFPITAALPSLKGDRPFSVEIEVPTGQWVIGYASYIDSNSNDPVFIQAKRESELSSTDYRSSVVPGVGHIGPWRSDVTIYNPNGRSITVDLAYHDQSGAKIAEAHVPIGGGEFVQYDDLLKSGVFGTITSDSLGMLRVNATVSPDQRFPLAFARTYNDDGSGKTYGQGIDGFAEARANVKPAKAALIPGVRSNAKYYTNFGVTNISNTDAVVTVKMLDPSTGAETAIQQHTVKANQSVVQRIDLGAFESASLKVEVTGGNVWAFASIVDKGTFDPEYVAATPLQ